MTEISSAKGWLGLRMTMADRILRQIKHRALDYPITHHSLTTPLACRDSCPVADRLTSGIAFPGYRGRGLVRVEVGWSQGGFLSPS